MTAKSYDIINKIIRLYVIILPRNCTPLQENSWNFTGHIINNGDFSNLKNLYIHQTDRYILSYPRKRVSIYDIAAVDSCLRRNDNMQKVICSNGGSFIPMQLHRIFVSTI